MPTFRGNRGNLLQHWVLVELVGSLRQQAFAKLAFIDAYSMSPTAARSPKAAMDQTASDFDRVKARLAGGVSPYEHAWRTLGQSLRSEYPSSAAFVRHCWQGRLYLLLCEADRPTADQIAVWLSGLDEQSTSFELHRGDWRERFACAMPTTVDAYYFSFDPNMYDRHEVRSPRRENMYPSDIAVVGKTVGKLSTTPILIQLSTYSVNGANSQSDVLDNLVPQFTELGFATTYVRADNSMMSYVFYRNLTVPSDLEERFRTWLGRARA